MTLPPEDHARLTSHLRGNSELISVLETIRETGLPQGAVFAGAIYQTIWNGMLSLDPSYGIRDYDVIYFHPDVSWEAEDGWERQFKAALPSDLAERVEVRNQARVHLWFGPRFGATYPPLADADEALMRALATVHALSVRLADTGEALQISAPLGLDDVYAMSFRAGPGGGNRAYVELKARSTLLRWPQATYDPKPWRDA